MRNRNICLALVFLVGLSTGIVLLSSSTTFAGHTTTVAGLPTTPPDKRIAVAGLLTAPPAAPATNQTHVFQQGLDGYTGVRDTWLSAADWNTPPQHTVNYGQNKGLVLSRDGDDNPLLRFDLSSIPANSAVLSATLSLYNTTPSSLSGTQDFARRVRLFRVLRDWDEGNQVASPVDASGKHGATGDHAFDYYPGEGTDIAWGARGMAAGTDYATTPESYADVVNEDWYTWDVTALVRAWVRGEQPNYGLVLRDATSYEVDNNDERSFVSSQGTADTGRRPQLTVVYNPDVPFADAGPDQENLRWDGSPVTLDGSASHDHPGGGDASLTYAWRFVNKAYASRLTGADIVPGCSPTPLLPCALAQFTPDVAGEWEIELTVTNNLGESAADRVHLRLLNIPAGHPCIYLTPAKLAALRARAVPSDSRWVQLQGEANDGAIHAKALVSQITGQTTYCNQAITATLALIANALDWPTKAGDIALVYDWCHAQLSAGQRTTFINYFNAWGDDTPKSEDFSGWGNYWPRYGYSYALMGLATYGDNPRAQEWLDEYRHRRYRDNDLALLGRIAGGGGWPEGMIYDWIANPPRVKALEAWRTATGENLFVSTAWFRERLGYLLLHRWPGLADEWGYQYHPYLSTGDTERNRGSIANYGRIMALILVERFPDEPLARQLQAYLAAPPANHSKDFLYHEEFLWFNPDQPSETPSLLTHYAPGTGTLFMRSGWPDGAADTDPSATYLTFQSGDHFTYHQHYDQNSFTLFKRGDLAVDSGVYSGDGLSNHDINYYVRTIAHNTLLVYNPAEDFSSARPDATSHDGGQRTLYPASRAPDTLEYLDQHATHYDTGNMLRFEDATQYTYALGDATKAYNNPTYNQAMDTALSGNVAKVSRFQREFVYLRPTTTGGGPPTADFVVLFDRVGVTQAAFSGQSTKLLFHTLNEPTVNGTPATVSPGETLYTGADLATTVSGDGKLFIKTLLPAARNMRKVGGRGVKSFWVFDANYDWHWDSNETQPRPTNDFEDVPYGEWRLELEPANTALEHNFLTVLYPTISNTITMPATTLITGTGLVGAHIADPGLNRVALFSSDPPPNVGGMGEHSAPAGTIVYSYRPTARTLNLLFDLAPGARYRLTTALGGDVLTVTLAPDQSGTYQASMQGVLSVTIDTSGGAEPAITPTDTPVGTPEPQRINLPLVFKEWSPSVSQSTATPTPTRTPAATAGTATATVSPTPTRTPTATATTPSGRIGHITYSLPNGRVYRIAAQAGATPEDVSLALNGLASGSEDAGLNISPDGTWLVLDTERFDPDCIGWACLAIVAGDLSSGEAVRANGTLVHPEGFGALASGGNLIVYPNTGGPTHTLDLWAVTRSGGNWSAPLLLTGGSSYAYNEFPAISAGGDQVVFDCKDQPFPSRALCAVGVDGTGFRVVLTQTDSPPGFPKTGALHHPDYAPDGSIIFEGDWGGEQIWRLPVGATEPVRVASPFGNDNSPCVLPDGHIASLWLERPGGSGYHEIKVMSADGSSYAMVLTGVDVFDIGIGCGE